MNEKVSINIEVLGINTTHNYLVPSDMSVSRITTLIMSTLGEEYKGAEMRFYIGHALIQQKTGKILSSGCSLRQLGIVDGEYFILT